MATLARYVPRLAAGRLPAAAAAALLPRRAAMHSEVNWTNAAKHEPPAGTPPGARAPRRSGRS